MRLSRRNPSHSLTAALARAWWGALIVLHLPVLVTLCVSIVTDGLDFGRLGSVVSVLLALALFALKVANVSFLRLRTTAQSLVALLLITAVVHHEAVAPGPREAMTLQATVAVAAIAATGVLAGRWRRLSRTWRLGLAPLLARRRLMLARRGTIAPQARLTGGFRRLVATSGPRAPPA